MRALIRSGRTQPPLRTLLTQPEKIPCAEIPQMLLQKKTR